MIHYCIVKYGNECHYQNVEELLKNITEPVHDSCLDIKFHLLTDKPVDIPYINNINYDKDDVKVHTHWKKLQFFDPKFIGASRTDQTIVSDLDMIWNKNPTEIVQHHVKKKTLLSVDRWWKKDNDACRMCGTFYKFNSHDFKYIPKVYNKHYEYFREYYALHEDAGSTRIVGGEQNFVQEMIELTGTIELMPPTFVMKSNWPKDNKDYDLQNVFIERFESATGLNYYDCWDSAILHIIKRGIN